MARRVRNEFGLAADSGVMIMWDSSNLNYVGSSGYGILPGGRYGRLTSSPKFPSNPRQDYAVYDASRGRTVSILTGQPFNGKDPRTGKTFQGGVEQVQTPAINPNDPNQRYQAVEVVRSPATAQATSDLMEEFRRNADSALGDFSSLTNQFREDLTAARNLSREATDITPTVNALTSAQREYGTNLDEATTRYQQALDEAAANQRGVVDQANAALPMYDEALNNIIANNLAAVQQNVSRYKMGTATPRSLGSAETGLLANAATQAQLPLELQRIGRRYDILSGLAMPTESAIGARDIAFAGGYLPATAGSRYSSQSNLATTIQNLRSAVAGMSYTDAVNYMRSAGVPAEIANQILGGQVQNLGGLNALEEASRYRGLQDLLGVDVSQPVGYNMALPAYPEFPTRYPSEPNAPTVVSPSKTTANYGFNGLDQYGRGVPYRGITPTATGGSPAGTRYAMTSDGYPVSVSPDVLPNYFGNPTYYG